MDQISSAVTIVLLVLLALVAVRILKTPIKWALKLVLNTAVGFVILLVLNFLGSYIGVHVAVNWVNALIAGVMGVPGVALVLLLRWLSLI